MESPPAKLSSSWKVNLQLDPFQTLKASFSWQLSLAQLSPSFLPSSVPVGKFSQTELALNLIMVWYGLVWFGMVWFGLVWFGLVWFGMVWYGLVWYGVWFGRL